jgi:FdhD protein
MNNIVENTIIRVEGSEYFSIADAQIKECPVSLALNGALLTTAVITASGDEDKELWALGYLKCNGLVNLFGDVRSMSINGGSVDVRVKSGIVKEMLRKPLKASWCTKTDTIIDAVNELSNAPLYRTTGSAHVAALFDPDGKRLFEAEDIGRHNAVDKVIGWALKENVNLSGVLLVTSGRLPVDLVNKAWMSEIGLMASVSAASADGVEAARLANITLAGFVRGDKMNIYYDSEPKRIELT